MPLSYLILKEVNYYRELKHDQHMAVNKYVAFSSEGKNSLRSQQTKTSGRSDGRKMLTNNTMYTKFGNIPLHSY
jgi:Lhr-like helicase